MKYIGLSVSVLVFIVIGFLGKLYINQKQINAQLSQINEQLTIKQNNAIVHKQYRDYERNMNGLKIDSVFKIQNNKSYFEMSDIITSNRLIFYFSEFHCNECIDTQISIINNHVDIIGKDNIIVLIKSLNNRFVSQFREKRHPPYQIFKIDKNFEYIFSDNDVPCYFVIESKTFRINSAFVPQKELSDLTEKYLEEIKRKYF